MSGQKPYPSDVTDEQWELIRPFLQAWKARRVAVSVSGWQGDYDLREIVNAIFYQKPQLAARMIEAAATAGLPCQWVAGDEANGNDAHLAAWRRQLRLDNRRPVVGDLTASASGQ